MPLVTLTGLPSSGKSTRARQLYDYLVERISGTKYRLHLISDDSLSISRTVYDLSTLPAHTRSANASEKDARATIYGAVKRVLTDKDIVILDGLNYIKGWRYQLHCEAKAGVNEERLQQRRDRLQENPDDNASGAETDSEPEPYEPGNWENLVFRYEEPNPMTRWDSPLFTVIWEDDEEQTKRTFDSIWEAIAGDGKKIIRPNQATEQRGRDASGDYLYIIDRETQDIVKQILAQQTDEGGGEVKIPRSTSNPDSLVIELPGMRKLGLPELQRHRRAFMGLNRGGIGLEQVTNMGVENLRESFVNYLNNAFDQ